MSSDHDIRHRGQSLEQIVLDHSLGSISKEQRVLFLVDIHAEISEPAATLEAVDDGCGIDDAAAGSVDQHRTRLHQGQCLPIDQMAGPLVERTMQGNNI